MPSENGRTFTSSLELATAVQRRAHGQVEEMLAAAEAKIAATQERLEKFATATAEATVTGSPPPQAAVALERDLADARKTVAACQALLPERLRKLREAEAKWRAENRAKMRERFTQQLDAALVQLRAADQALAAIELLRQDIAAADPEGVLQLPLDPTIGSLVRPKLQQLESVASAWPGGRSNHTAPPNNGLVAVRRLPADRFRPLKRGHRLEQALTQQLMPVLERYAIGETFGTTPELAKLGEMVSLVERVPKGGAV
jgi:hypothetical protein